MRGGPTCSAADARKLAQQPHLLCGVPSLRLFVWAVLKAERGQTIRQARVSAMQDAMGRAGCFYTGAMR